MHAFARGRRRRGTTVAASLGAVVATALTSVITVLPASTAQAAEPAVGPIDPNWNVFDRYDASTRLIHYTNLLTQPWKARGHPYGDLWFRYFAEARREGFITADDIELTLVRSYARQDLLEGNDWTLKRLTGQYVRETTRLLGRRLRALLA